MFKKLFFKSLLMVFVLLSAVGKAEGQTKETFPFVQRDSTLYLDVARHPRSGRKVFFFMCRLRPFMFISTGGHTLFQILD